MDPKDPTPFIKWAGGKHQLLPELLSRISNTFKRYHEPFVGGGALFFGLNTPNGAFLADHNLRLVRTWRAIQTNVYAVIALLHEYAENHERDGKGFYTHIRGKNIDVHTNDVDVAAWFIYLNKTCFNGLYRVNSRNEFNVPMGKYKTTPLICDEMNLLACHKKLNTGKVAINHVSYETAMLFAQPGDLVYCDPPYLPLNDTSDFTAYTTEGFDMLDHKRLRDCVLELKHRDVRVIVSNSDTPVIRELYKRDFKIEVVSARRSVNSDTAKRGAINELLIT